MFVIDIINNYFLLFEIAKKKVLRNFVTCNLVSFKSNYQAQNFQVL